MSSLIYFTLFNSALAALLERKRPHWNGSRLQVFWSKGANLTTIAVASVVRRSRQWCKFKRRFLQQIRLMNMHPGKGAERMIFILDTECLRRLNFHHLVWSLKRTNSYFQSSSFQSIQGSGREGDRGSPTGRYKKVYHEIRHRGEMLCEIQWDYQGRCWYSWRYDWRYGW
jgi:hypothetical protein